MAGNLALAHAQFETIHPFADGFAGACARAVEDAGFFESRVREIETRWRARLGKVRQGSSPAV